MKQYVFELVIDEGCDEWWEEVNSLSTAEGIEKVQGAILNILHNYGLDIRIRLKRFNDENGI